MIQRYRASEQRRKPIPRLRSKQDGSIIDCIHDPQLFASWFDDDWRSWQAWLAFLCALFALPMDADDQLAIYRECTSRNDAPSEIAREAWLVCGRRAGKSFILALVAVFLAAFFDYRPYLAPGERGTILVIAADRKQSRVILRYIAALLKGVPMLAQLITRETAEGFDLANSVSIEVATCSFRSVRGYTLVAALLDEVAFWRAEDSTEPDYEVLNALRPGMSTIPNSMLLCASSPYARRGVLYEAHRRHFGREHDPVLVWQAATRRMNPSIPQSFIDAEMERDAASARAEYLAKFRADIEAFITREAVEACISKGVYERGRIEGVTYSAFCDPSGGSADAMTLAIASKQSGIATLDAKGTHFPEGTKFRATYKGRSYNAEIKGGVCRSSDGATRNSPSEAAVKITGKHWNGWRFWHCMRPGDSDWTLIDQLRPGPSLDDLA